MDTSKEYILMCKKAEEIRKEWKPKEGDFVYGAESDGVWPINDWHLEEANLSLFIWLPRQDQLQEMVTDISTIRLLSRLLNCKHSFLTPHQDALFSMEQLWLAFVMKKKYQKAWDGEEWIK